MEEPWNHLKHFQTRWVNYSSVLLRRNSTSCIGLLTNNCLVLFQGVITQLSEQISTLNERMDEFTSRVEELNSKFSVRKVSASQQNLALPAEACTGSGPTSHFVTGLSNGSLAGSLLPHSSSSSQLVKESPLMEEVGFCEKLNLWWQIDLFFSVPFWCAYLVIWSNSTDASNHTKPTPDHAPNRQFEQSSARIFRRKASPRKSR